MGEQADAQDAAKRWSKAADEKIRKQFLAESRRICDDKVRAFVDCSKENGLMVIFRCREENKIMNECVQNYTTDEKWEQFRKEKIETFVRDGKVIVPKEFTGVGPPK